MLAFGTHLTPTLFRLSFSFFRAGGLLHRSLPSPILAMARYLAVICKTHRHIRLHPLNSPPRLPFSLACSSRPPCLLSVASTRYSPRSTTVTSATAPTPSISAAPISARARARPHVRYTKRFGPLVEACAAALDDLGESSCSLHAAQLAIVPQSSLLIRPLRLRVLQLSCDVREVISRL